MIKVNVIRHHNEIQSFSMAGHAEAGPYGYDLVCAGASAISFGAVNAVAELCEVEMDIEMEEDGGYLHCAVPELAERHVREKVQLLLEGMLVSLQTIADQYGEHITLIDR
ncbi:ribosomal-processing cysteine protease Prp [Bacillus piscicola]|uniref:ribosomal-processing cysteine protease Prp n=1 Tax=Bacillus piscicola TaxID=1632684 RepID=UPI001F08A85E|nr:ribosomal-processing cysteine protease Prp [Bacillus piscicola]